MKINRKINDHIFRAPHRLMAGSVVEALCCVRILLIDLIACKSCRSLQPVQSATGIGFVLLSHKG